MFYRFIIGKKGVTKKQIEFQTNTKIIIPNSNDLRPITVVGESNEDVTNALVSITKLVKNSKRCVSLTHFFSIPINTDEIKKNFESFKSEILTNFSESCLITPQLFQNPLKLHLTLSILVLCDQVEIQETIDKVNNFKIKNAHLFNLPLKIRLKGLGYFGDNPSKVNVLYSKVDKSQDYDRLQTIANLLQDFLYQEKIILKKEYETITLHMTLMNVSFLKKSTQKFNCSRLLDEYDDWDFGTCAINDFFLSKLYPTSADGYYMSEAVFSFGNKDD